jgi:nucleotide-binding universal stress UspA family protein
MTPSVFKHILVPIEGSEPSVRSAHLAFKLLKESAGQLTVLYVIDDIVLNELSRFNGKSALEARMELEQHGLRYLKLIKKEAEREGITTEILIREGNPFEEIVAAARELGVDLIAMGHVGQRGSSRILLGSVTSHVLDFAHCPVLVVKH